MMQKKTIIQSVMYVLQNAKKTGINLVPHPLKSFQCSINHWQPGPRPQFQFKTPVQQLISLDTVF